jgi:hypothetical protein
MLSLDLSIEFVMYFDVLCLFCVVHSLVQTQEQVKFALSDDFDTASALQSLNKLTSRTHSYVTHKPPHHFGLVCVWFVLLDTASHIPTAFVCVFFVGLGFVCCLYTHTIPLGACL